MIYDLWDWFVFNSPDDGVVLVVKGMLLVLAIVFGARLLEWMIKEAKEWWK